MAVGRSRPGSAEADPRSTPLPRGRTPDTNAQQHAPSAAAAAASARYSVTPCIAERAARAREGRVKAARLSLANRVNQLALIHQHLFASDPDPA